MRERKRKFTSWLHRKNTSQPVSTESAYVNISKPDAIAELCLPTGDEQLDHLHVILIDLVQKGFIQAVRITEDPRLRYIATAAGKQYVQDQFQSSVDQFLQGMFGDSL